MVSIRNGNLPRNGHVPDWQVSFHREMLASCINFEGVVLQEQGMFLLKFSIRGSSETRLNDVWNGLNQHEPVRSPDPSAWYATMHGEVAEVSQRPCNQRHPIKTVTTMIRAHPCLASGWSAHCSSTSHQRIYNRPSHGEVSWDLNS